MIDLVQGLLVHQINHGFRIRLASLVGITERETGVGKLGWHGNSTGFDRKIFFFPILRNERKKKD